MPKIKINDQEVNVENGITILQACESIGIEIPRFCYHEKLAIAGNCRMCLVEMEKSPKPIASCAMPVTDGMVITTNSPLVKKARNGVMEFLLINHPLDCPICDQGGECDLQDQAMSYGRDKNRFSENKRAVKDKNLGPLIKTVMTRCIHCTRCVRFAQDVAGVSELGATGRGEEMEIDTFIEKTISSELSGNIIDLCPVGALTSKPYAFEARSWELSKTETIDIHDALGSNIRVDTRGREVKRVLPRINEEINEEWISDKTRFAYDGLGCKRLDRPWVKKNNKLVESEWSDAFDVIAKKIQNTESNKIAAIVGDLADCESIFSLKKLFNIIGSPHTDCRQDGSVIDSSFRGSYIFNSEVCGIDKADFILLVGCDPRWEAPILNSRIRKRYLTGDLDVALIGSLPNRENGLTYPYSDLGSDPSVLNEIASGKHEITNKINSANFPMIIIGNSAVCRPDSSAIIFRIREISEKYNIVRGDWNGFNFMSSVASRVGALDLGFVPGQGGYDFNSIIENSENGNLDIVYLLGADEFSVDKLTNSFVIYQGHHGDIGARNADVILPGAAYTEKNATYVNLEGKVQRALKATFPPNEAREDWTIIRALSSVINSPLPFNNLVELRSLMENEHPIFSKIDLFQPQEWKEFGIDGAINKKSLGFSIRDFYMTNPITRASHTMGLCKNEYEKRIKSINS
ncbi:MAG: NADH-quinone oxidoreductase subunit G [Rhodospirillaceae bacterium]|nr:NADH-quinone oxidoreductase subunit G [Rhodospirillaceae bacterium]|tara:strand:- start:2461 stop:4527 length:2067 start_codon:yes stop_codon:yes gene_type:complete